MQLEKLFGSKCRKKILEKFILEHNFNPKKGFFIRELCRDIDEQINSVRRELQNLEKLGILVAHSDNNKKVFQLDQNCPIIDHLMYIFAVNFDSMEHLRNYFKGRRHMSLLVIGGGIEDMSRPSTNNLIDILIIGEVDRTDFQIFLTKNFFGRKIKYAVISESEFHQRLKFGDKLITRILKQPGNQVLKDSLGLSDYVQK